MKHGPRVLIDGNSPVAVIATRDDSDPASVQRYENTVSTLQEARARDIMISIVTPGYRIARESSKHVIEIGTVPEIFSPILELVPPQLLAYQIAARRGCDVDQPRNLANSTLSGAILLFFGSDRFEVHGLEKDRPLRSQDT
jgi:glutamine---fructose-6-phosphate transaminase (isomerizing)